MTGAGSCSTGDVVRLTLDDTPSRAANAAISARDVIPSLARMFETWTAAVFGEMYNRAASSALLKPSAEQRDDFTFAGRERIGPGDVRADAEPSLDGVQVFDAPAAPTSRGARAAFSACGSRLVEPVQARSVNAPCRRAQFRSARCRASFSPRMLGVFVRR